MDEIQALADANNGYRAARILQMIKRSEAHRALDEEDRPLVDWLSGQLIASRRGAQSIALAESTPPDKIGPDERRDVQTTFSDQNKMYVVFSQYSRAENPVAHADWVDQVVGALDSLASGGWDSLRDDQKQKIRGDVAPFLRRLREASDRELTGRGSPLVV
jgi:hypothetical protein